MVAAVLPFNIPGFNPKVTLPKVKFPAGATDCHAHLFGPQSAFPYVSGAALWVLAEQRVVIDAVKRIV